MITYDLQGRTALVTGSNRGIGKAMADALEEAGAKVIRTCSKECDLSDRAAVYAFIEKTKKEHQIDILVNNAGITRDGLVATMKEETWDQVLDTNLKGAFNMIRHCTGLFLRNREGCIINISSVSGMIGNPGQANYSASKAGLIGLTKTVAKELGSKGIRCNAIAPGFIKTKMTEDQENSPLLSMIPLGRMGEAEDVAQAAAYLAEAGYVTGEVLRVDGGIAM